MASGTTTEATVFGVSHRQNDLSRLGLQEGRFLDALDELEHGQVCVIGPGVRRDLFGYGKTSGDLPAAEGMATVAWAPRFSVIPVKSRISENSTVTCCA